MTSQLSRITAEQRREAADAVELLTDTLSDAKLKLPSVSVDWHPGRVTGTVLVELGRAPAHVVVGIATLLREGLTARAQQQS